MLYSAVGIVSMLMGGSFLDYSVLHSDPVKGQQYGIIVIEAGVGNNSKAAHWLAIFHAFCGEGAKLMELLGYYN